MVVEHYILCKTSTNKEFRLTKDAILIYKERQL